MLSDYSYYIRYGKKYSLNTPSLPLQCNLRCFYWIKCQMHNIKETNWNIPVIYSVCKLDIFRSESCNNSKHRKGPGLNSEFFNYYFFHSTQTWITQKILKYLRTSSSKILLEIDILTSKRQLNLWNTVNATGKQTLGGVQMADPTISPSHQPEYFLRQWKVTEGLEPSPNP